LDVLSYNCGDVEKDNKYKDEKGFGVITPKEASKKCFRDLGHDMETYGAFSHEIKAKYI
jgi:hypothetical protein